MELSMVSKEPGFGELEKFVSDLISRSPGLRREVAEIALIRKHRERMRRKTERTEKGEIRRDRPVPKAAALKEIGIKRQGRIEKYGLCNTCGERAVSSGESRVALCAGESGQCLQCYVGEHQRKKDPWIERGESYKTGLIEKHGVCPSCREHAVTNGTSAPSLKAHEAGLCLYCWRASRPKRKKIVGVGLCKTCGFSNVTSGKSQTARYARRNRQCIRCYGKGRM